MARVGEIVRGDNRLMKVMQRYKQFAHCVWIDFHGTINTKWFYAEALTPLEVAMGAKSLWPESGNLSEIEMQREEELAKFEIEEERRLRRQRARRARRSKRIAA